MNNSSATIPPMPTRPEDLRLIEDLIRKAGHTLPMHHEVSLALQALERIERGAHKNIAQDTLEQIERFGRFAHVCHQSRGPYTLGLAGSIAHDLTVSGDCAVTLADGEDGIVYEIRVMQDGCGGHAVTFPNLNTQGGRPVSITEIAADSTTILVHCAGGGYFLHEATAQLSTGALGEAR